MKNEKKKTTNRNINYRTGVTRKGGFTGTSLVFIQLPKKNTLVVRGQLSHTKIIRQSK